MKKILILLLLFAALSVNAQTDTTEVQTDSAEIRIIILPDSTTIGAPDGKSVSKEIGPAGGKIVSDDGRVELIFPEGALSVNTFISIQPIVNLIPNGNGKAYGFEPSGIRFQKPVQIFFRYTNEEAAICPPELKFMALQDHKGKWEYMNYDDWDSTSKSLKGSITHFSTFVDGNQVELNNTEITLKVGKTHFFALNVVQPPSPPGNSGEDELPPLPITINRGNREELWKVNEDKGGNARHGTIAPIRGQPIKATYTAPAKLTADPVTLKLELNDIIIERVRSRVGRRGWTSVSVRRTPNVATFSCKVKLYDEYKITAISKHILEACRTELIDSSNFIVRLYSGRVEIPQGHIKNRPPTLTKTKCETITRSTEGCIGPVHFNGELVTGYKISGDNPPKIEIHFQSVDVIYVKSYATIGNFQGPTKDDLRPASILDVYFIANRTAQVISLERGPFIFNSLKVEPL